MTKFAQLSPALAVAGALTSEDFAEAARLGFKSILNNRPDYEEANQLTAREEAALAWRAGLAYRHVPVVKHEVLDAHALDAQEQALGSMPGPILVHCRSGLRSTIMWAALSVRAGAPIDEVLSAAADAGQDLSGLRDEIEAAAAAEQIGLESVAPAARVAA